MEKYEKWARLLKLALIMTFLMAMFSAGMTAATISQSDIEGLTIWKPILQTLLIIGPILVAEFFAFRYFNKKYLEEKEKAEKEAKEKARLERKAKAEARRASQPKKKKK